MNFAITGVVWIDIILFGICCVLSYLWVTNL